MSTHITKNRILDFTVSLKIHHRSPNTITSYTTNIQKLELFLGGSELTKEQMLSYKQWLSSQGFKQRTINAYLAAANYFCDVMAQHCDTPYPQTMAQERGCYGIGYNSDMEKDTPDSCLCSVIWNWSAYYTSVVESIIDGTYNGGNYYGGMEEGLVEITKLADFCSEGTEEKVEEKRAKILSGEFNVFDGEIETNTGEIVGSPGSTLDDGTITGGINWYYKNVQVVD